MEKLKFTQQELRQHQVRLQQLQRYLPTLQLRKALLQIEVASANSSVHLIKETKGLQWRKLVHSAPLLGLDAVEQLQRSLKVIGIEQTSENVAGVEVPHFLSMSFQDVEYSLYDSPPWLDAFIEEFREYRTLETKESIASQKLAILSRELREVYIKVNLFEKILIPRCRRAINRTKIFLHDRQLAAIAQAKVAKTKIMNKMRAAYES
jgi:V/A-type H+-transporting ATPase subunit D